MQIQVQNDLETWSVVPIAARTESKRPLGWISLFICCLRISEIAYEVAFKQTIAASVHILGK